MINTLQELLEDYARYSCMEDKIDPEMSETLQKEVKDYLKQLSELNLLNIQNVIKRFICGCGKPKVEHSCQNCKGEIKYS